MNLQDKVIAVTGGANGIGKALCQRFMAAGAKVVAVIDIEEGPARLVAEEIGGVSYTADVSQEADIQKLVASLEQRFGRIDLFCSNAGIGFGNPPGGHAASQSNQQWQSIWAVNVMAHVYAARAALPKMLKRGSGYFLNTASAAGLLSQINDASYSTTKHAAIGFAESLAISHGDEGIGVSVLCPQAVATRMLGVQDRGCGWFWRQRCGWRAAASGCGRFGSPRFGRGDISDLAAPTGPHLYAAQGIGL